MLETYFITNILPLRTFGIYGTQVSKGEDGHNGEPLITTPSAKRTRDGFDFSFAFLAAVSIADFRAALLVCG